MDAVFTKVLFEGVYDRSPGFAKESDNGVADVIVLGAWSAARRVKGSANACVLITISTVRYAAVAIDKVEDLVARMQA